MDWMISGESSFHFVTLLIASIIKCKHVSLISTHFTSETKLLKLGGGLFFAFFVVVVFF